MQPIHMVKGKYVCLWSLMWNNNFYFRQIGINKPIKWTINVTWSPTNRFNCLRVWCLLFAPLHALTSQVREDSLVHRLVELRRLERHHMDGILGNMVVTAVYFDFYFGTVARVW